MAIYDAKQVPEAYLEDLLKAAPGIVYALRVDGEALIPKWVSDHITRVLGYDADECLGNPGWWASHLHPEDREKTAGDVPKLLSSGHLIHEYRFRHKDGTYVWLRDELRVVSDASGQPVEMVGVWTDITEHKRAEEALRDSEARLKAITDHLPGGVYRRVLHADGKVSYPYLSAGFGRIFNIDTDEVMANSQYLFDSIHPDDRGPTLEAVETSAETIEKYDQEFRLVDDAGRVSWCRSIAQPRLEENGDIVWDGVVVDITERKQAEQALRDSEERYRILYNNTPVMMHSIDPDGRLLSVSEYWLKGLGYERDEVIGKKSTDFLTEASRHRVETVEMSEFIKTGLANDVPLQFVKKNGEVIDVLLSAISERDGSGRMLRSLAVVIDITERKRAEEEIEKARARLNGAIESMSDGFAVFDADDRFVLCNGKYRQMWAGVDDLLVPDTPFEDFVCAAAERGLIADAEGRVEEWVSERVRRHRAAEGVDEQRFADGRWIEANERKTSDGGIVCIRTDITERKRAEEALRESEEHFRDLIEGSIEGILIHRDHKPLMVNETRAAMHGYSIEEVLAMDSVVPLIAPHDRARLVAYRDARLRGEDAPPRYEFQGLHKDGSLIWFENVVRVVTWKGQPAIQSTLIDITERKRAEEELKRNHDLLSFMSALQSQFIADADWNRLFDGMLDGLLSLTDSEYGFIGQVRHDEGGMPYLKTYAMSNLAWDEETRRFYDENAPQGLEFTNLDTLFGAVMTGGEAVIANDPAHDPRRDGLPEGHPPLKAFLGMPFYSGTTLVGMMGIANRPGGYDEELVRYLEPLAATSGTIIAALRADEQRREAAEALRESEERFRAVVDNLPSAVFLKDKEGRYRLVNRRYEEWYGVTRHDIAGQTVYDRFSKERADAYTAEDAEVMESARVVHRELQSRFPNGGNRTTLLARFPIIGPDGIPIGVGGVETDVTEQRRAEEELRQSAVSLADAQRIAKLGSWEWDREINDVSWSDELYRIYGLERANFSGTYEEFLELVHPDDRARVREVVDNAFQKQETYGIDHRIILPNGEQRYINSCGAPRLDKDGKVIGWRGTALDITERKRAEEELRDLGARLITAREEEARHIARELHDEIGQSLALLTIELELSARTAPEGTDEIIERLQRLATQCKGLATGIHNLSHRLHPAALEQLGLTAAVRSLCKELSNRHDVRIGFSQRRVLTSIPRNIALCIYRVTQDALSNVIEHSGSRIARVEITGNSKAIRLRISDSGVGFEPTLAKGAGLGLISMRERLRLVGGEISIHSRPSRGTRIDARVPLSPSTAGS